MVLTDDERKLALEKRVGLYPAPRYLRFPIVQAAGWEITVVRGSERLCVALGATREEALVDARRRLQGK